MMNSLFKSALQGVVQKMATPENVQSTLQFVQEKFKEVPKSQTESRITDVKLDDYVKKISDSKLGNFPVYLAKDGNFKIIYEKIGKQVFSTNVQEEALVLAGILERAVELVFEAYNFNKLEALIETILSHQTWSEFHLACSVGCPSFVSTFLGKLANEEKSKIVINTRTNDTGDLPIHLAVKNGHLEIVSLLIILGADPKAKDRRGRCSFHLAAMNGITVLEKLLKDSKNSGILEKDNDGKMPLILAGEERNIQAVHLLARVLDYEIYKKMIYEGNQPLHSSNIGPWRKLTAEAILEEHPEFIEVPDSLNQTPLVANTKAGDVDMVLVLIAHGANVDQADREGKTPLIYAMEKGSMCLVKLYLALGADYRSDGFKKEFSNLKSGKNQIMDLIKQLQPEERPKPKSFFDLTQKRILQESKKSKKLRLLSLDGGGIRGLASVLILTTLESRLRKKLNKPEVKLIDYFDWIAGTSTGAIIGLGLISGKSTMDVLRLYLRFRDKVFCGKRPYDTRRLELVLQKEFGLNTTLSEVASGSDKRIFVTTTNAKTIPPELVLMRNYEMYGEESTIGIKVWYAARCSSAAPTYFEAVDSKYLDGGLMANNPCSDLMVEVAKFAEYSRVQNQKVPEIGCVLSIGTGKCPPKETKVTSINMPTGFADILQNGISSISGIMSLSKMFIDQICSSDGPVVERAQALAHANGAPFFRLTPNLAMEVDLDSAEDQTVVELLWAARCHSEKTANHDINDLVEILTVEA